MAVAALSPGSVSPPDKLAGLWRLGGQRAPAALSDELRDNRGGIGRTAADVGGQFDQVIAVIIAGLFTGFFA